MGHPTRHHRAVATAVLPVVLCLLAPGCAHRRALQLPPRLTAAARLLNEGQYIEARTLYTAVRDSLPGTPAGAEAQYGLAYLNVFYRHPAPAWERALEEFERFAADYPEHERAGEVSTWIRVLSSIQSLEEQNEANRERLEDIVQSSQSAKSRQEGSYEVLLESVKDCYRLKDSLNTSIRLLEEVIETIEKAP